MHMNNHDLINKIISSGHSMVTKERFDTILRNFNIINGLDGDIVECGVWRGGFSIFLATLFENKKIWMFDSFEGFQPIEKSVFKYDKIERHTPE